MMSLRKANLINQKAIYYIIKELIYKFYRVLKIKIRNFSLPAPEQRQLLFGQFVERAVERSLFVD